MRKLHSLRITSTQKVQDGKNDTNHAAHIGDLFEGALKVNNDLKKNVVYGECWLGSHELTSTLAVLDGGR
jgi:hypothetical protein